jgi:hypothetical protein
VPRRRKICEDGACEVLGVVVGWYLCFKAVGVAADMVVLCVARSNGFTLIPIFWRDGTEKVSILLACQTSTS